MNRITLMFLLFFTSVVRAESDSHPADIVIGQSVELSGQATGKENMEGALAYFEWVNSHGGLYGSRIVLKSYDDARSIKKTTENTERLLHEDNAIALFGYRSTPTVEAALPIITREKVALIAPFSGAQALHHPFNPYLYNLRATYQDETSRMADILTIMAIKKVAVLYQDDKFGEDGLEGFKKNLERVHINPLGIVKYNRKDLEVNSAVQEISKLHSEAVLMACTPQACVNFIKKMRPIVGLNQWFMTLSNVNSDEFFKALGTDGRGVGVVQVMPSPKNFEATVVREFRRVEREMKNPPPLSYSVLEGFVAAKLVVEALRRTGPHPTRERLIKTLDTSGEIDLGGIKLHYTPTNHDGSEFTEMTVIGKNGALLR
ncbi:MAG TPA: ABC transporter substrate-binding protein [Burkholderiaceae bacterium]|jgi:ABC-type branched-subunit amino acid transport system substrate-binding protein